MEPFVCGLLRCGVHVFRAVHLASFPLAWFLLAIVPRAQIQQPFTIEQALAVHYAQAPVPAPAGARFTWVEVQEGRHNVWVGGTAEAGHPLTNFNADDGQDIRDLAWTPDGQTLLFTRGAETGADGKPANPAHLQPPPAVTVWSVATHGRDTAPTPVAEGSAPLPLPDNRHVLYLRRGQIWEADLAAPPALPPVAEHLEGVPDKVHVAVRQRVFDRGADAGMVLSPDGHMLAFVSRRDKNHSFIGLFDLASGILSFPSASTGNDTAPCFSPDGRRLAWLRAPWTTVPEFTSNRVSRLPWSAEVLTLGGNDPQPAFTALPGLPGSVLPHVSTGTPRVWWAADGQIVFASEADGWVHLYAVDAEHRGTSPRLLTPGDFEVEDATLSPDGRRMVYASNQVRDPGDADRRHIWSVDLVHREAKPEPLTGGKGLETHPVFAHDGSAVLTLQAGLREPDEPYLIAPGTSPVALMPKQAANAGEAFTPPQPVLFASTDKRFILHGQLFLPPGPPHNGTRRPAVLFCHGGPRRQMLLGYPAMEYYQRAYALNQYLASRGFVVLSVNYRGGIGYGLDFREAEGTGANGASEYSDVLGALAFLRSRPDVDSKRIGSWGGSYGGYLTALALARNSDEVAAGVDFHGVHEWELEDNRGDWLQGTAAAQAAIAAKAHASSPMAGLATWTSPVLLIHGDNDANVAYPQTPVLADALRARGVSVGELIFPDEIHEFLLHRDWLASYEATADFFERTLGPKHPLQ